jgi:4-alpha-glucanotransferase
LQNLAQLYGVQTSYRDVTGKRQQAFEEPLLSVLRAMGAPVDRIEDAPGAVRERRQTVWQRCIEPVVVDWDSEPTVLKLRLPERTLGRKMTYQIQLESGEVKSRSFDPQLLPTIESAEVESVRYVTKGLGLPATLPWGYHRLTLEVEGNQHDAFIISAPLKTYPGDSKEKIWGVFVPLYALHSRRSWGAGDFSDMEALYDWLMGLGGQMVATLPFLAAFLDEPFEPSPYSPASRLFWNEFYLDLNRIPQMTQCSETEEALSSIESRHSKDIEELRSAPMVDYRRQMALKRKMLEEAARSFFSSETAQRHAPFRRFLNEHPAVEDYARFRATGERIGKPWPEWPEPLRNGALSPGDYEEQARQYHLFVQWAASEQIDSLSKKSREAGPGLYLDLPLGVHPFAYDLWRKRDLFPSNVSGGAPPDIVFTKGQNWGFSPTHPEKVREDRYGYVIDYLRHIMRHAGMLRLDHVMGIHRIYWIPSGMDADKGVFVRYPAEEFYAILSVESHRNKCRIVGENLGTVPSYVNEALSRHNILKMYVVEYELESRDSRVLRSVPATSKASLNTHDMPPFAGFLRGEDIEDRKRIGLLGKKDAEASKQERSETKADLERFFREKGRLKGPATEEAILRASLAHLGASRAPVVVINLEDLWLETRAQNLPGTSGEQPNWRLKIRHSLEEIKEIDNVTEVLAEVDRIRKKGREKRDAKGKQ